VPTLTGVTHAPETCRPIVSKLARFLRHSVHCCCLGGAVVERRTRDRKVTGSIPGRSAIKSSRSTQPSLPPG